MSNTSTTTRIAVRDAMVPKFPGQSFFQTLRELGASAFEMHVERDGTFQFVILEDGSAPYSFSNVQELKARLDAENISICALLLGTDFSSDNADQEVQWAIDAVKAAQVLGAPAVRLDPMTHKGDLPVETMIANVIRCLNVVLGETADTGVSVGLENHGYSANDPNFLDSIFAGVNNERLGITLDTGNFYWSGIPISELYGVIEHFAPRARHTHVKSIRYPEELRDQRRPIGYEYGKYAIAIDKGDIDMKRVVKILGDAGYQGALCIENETLTQLSPEDTAAVLRGEVAELVEALAAN